MAIPAAIGIDNVVERLLDLLAIFLNLFRRGERGATGKVDAQYTCYVTSMAFSISNNIPRWIINRGYRFSIELADVPVKVLLSGHLALIFVLLVGFYAFFFFYPEFVLTLAIVILEHFSFCCS